MVLAFSGSGADNDGLQSDLDLQGLERSNICLSQMVCCYWLRSVVRVISSIDGSTRIF